MHQMLPCYIDTSKVCIELDEDVNIYISKSTRITFSTLKKDDIIVLIEVNNRTQPTLMKYQYIVDTALLKPNIVSNADIQIQIVIGSKWNQYSIIKRELSQLNWQEIVFESHSTSLNYQIEELVKYAFESTECKLILFSSFYGLLASLKKDSKKTENTLPNDREKIRMIEKKMVENFTNRPPSLEELAQLIGMSVSKMKLLFKTYYGDSIYQFHQKAKLNYAADLLKSRRYTVSQVAYKVGYNHSIKFIKIFEKHFGQTPGKYKNETITLMAN